jgi:hypothetical protein
MAEEENNDIVTYIVKIKVTLTLPDPDEPIPDHDHRETQPTANVGAETVPLEDGDVAQAIGVGAETSSLKDDERDDVVEAAEESIPDREKQDMHVGAKTVVSLSKDDEGSVEGDNIAARDSSSAKAAAAIMKCGRKKKKRGRKSFAEIEKMKRDAEALLGNRIKEETGKDVVAGGSSSFQLVRKRRGRKRKAEKETTKNEVPQVHKKLKISESNAKVTLHDHHSAHLYMFGFGVIRCNCGYVNVS